MYHHHGDDGAAAPSTITHHSKHPLARLRSNDKCLNWVGNAREQGERTSPDRDHSVKLGFFTPAAVMCPLTERRSMHPAL